MKDFVWDELAFGSKKEVRELNTTFIAAARELSAPRFTQLVKQFLPQANILVGIAEEDYVLGFENQPQFRMLRQATIQTIIDKVNASPSKHKIYTLRYPQRDTNYVIEKLKPRHVVFVNGSWKFSFHTRDTYYTLKNQGISYELVSPFANEDGAKHYVDRKTAELSKSLQDIPFSDTKKQTYTAEAMLLTAKQVAKRSYDYSFQTGVTLGKKTKDGNYMLLTGAHNVIVPYETYAMHHGAAREKNFSPPNDLNHYDAVHAEVELIITAGQWSIDVAGTTLFINLLPCPTCARMLCQTDIAEIVYQEDHSAGYAVALLEKAGKIVRRIVPATAVA